VEAGGGMGGMGDAWLLGVEGRENRGRYGAVVMYDALILGRLAWYAVESW